MRIKSAIIAIMAIIIFSAPAWAACTTAQIIGFQNGSQAIRATTTCTAAANGTFTSLVINDDRIKGMFITHVYTTPGATTPQAAWDATIKSAGGLDLMGGAILNASATDMQVWLPLFTTGVYYQPPIKDTLTLAITGNNVNAAIITFDIWMWRN